MQKILIFHLKRTKALIQNQTHESTAGLLKAFWKYLRKQNCSARSGEYHIVFKDVQNILKQAGAELCQTLTEVTGCSKKTHYM